MVIAVWEKYQAADATVEQDGGVDLVVGHDSFGSVRPSTPIPIRSDLAPGKCVRA